MNTNGKHFLGHVLTVALAATIAIGFAIALLDRAGVFDGMKDRYEVRALVPTAASLGSGSGVRIGGIKVGRVTGVEQKGLGALVTMEVDPEHGPLPVDTRAAVRLRTLIGENYVEIDPGTSTTPIASGSTLPMAQVDEYVEVDQILSVLRGPTRARARDLLRSTGGALAGNGGRLNRVVRDFSGAVTEGFSPIGRVLEQDREELARFIDSLGNIARTVGSRGTQIRTLSRDARRSFAAIAAQDRSVAAVLERLPPTLEAARSTSTTLGRVSRSTTPTLTSLAGAITDLRPAVRALRPAAQETTRLVADLDRATQPLKDLLDAARTASAPVSAALPQLRAVVCQASPMLSYLAPYRDDIIAVLSGLGSTVNYYDAAGHAGRVSPTIGEDTLVALPQDTADAMSTLIQSGLLSKVRQFGYNAYPEPRAGGDHALGRTASGPVASGRQGVKFTRVMADCG